MHINISDDVLNNIVTDCNNVTFYIDKNINKYLNKFFHVMFNCNNEIVNNNEAFILAYLFGEHYSSKIMLNHLSIKNLNIQSLEYDGTQCMLNKFNYDDTNICCINCSDCINCIFCMNCDKCENCYNCKNSSNSKFCNDSNEMIDCRYCNFSDKCTNCLYCNKCTTCIECSYSNLINKSMKCINCSSSENLYNCYNSSNCENLTNCDRCIMCTDGILLNQCTKVNKSYTCNNCYKCKNLYQGREINNIDGSNILYYTDESYSRLEFDNISVKYHKYNEDIAYGVITKDDQVMYEGSFKINNNTLYLIYGKLHGDNVVYHGLIGRVLKDGELNNSKLNIIYGSEINSNNIININHF